MGISLVCWVHVQMTRCRWGGGGGGVSSGPHGAVAEEVYLATEYICNLILDSVDKDM